MTEWLTGGGVSLPLFETAAGPIVDIKQCGPLQALAWVINLAVTNPWNLVELLRHGEDAHLADVYARTPAAYDDDADEAAERWRAAAGSHPGTDALILGPGMKTGRVIVPRAVVIELVERLERIRKDWTPS